MNRTERYQLAEELKTVVDGAPVLCDDVALDNYSRDMSAEPAGRPDVVVLPDKVEQVQSIIRYANSNAMAVVPFLTGTNLGGLTIPRRGGVVVDLKRMNRVLEVNADCMYAVVEPGVSFGDMERYLRRDYPSLRLSQPAAPAITSIIANYLLGGLGTLTMKAGCHGDMINGMEVVLPAGELIRTGSIVGSPYWFARHPLPDFSGLFVNWKGTSGIVTKASVQLWPRQPYEDFYAVGVWNLDDTPRVLDRICKAELSDEQSARIREVIELAFGLYQPNRKQMPWDVLVMHRISGATKNVLDAKVTALTEILEDETRNGRRAEILWDFSANDLARRVSEFPSTGFAVSWMDYGREGKRNPGGGATWVGGYLPLSELARVIGKSKKIVENYRFPPLGTQRTMGQGRYCYAGFLISYDRKNESEVADVRKMMRELTAVQLEHGGLINKAAEWATEMMWEQADLGYLDLLKRIKSLLDPKGIMNPGKLCL